jgi:hypothetical protein
VTLSLGSSFIIAIAATAVLAIFLAIVVISSVISDRPSRPRQPPPSKTAVSGTRHEGDPRSMAPRQDQVGRPAPGAGPPLRDRPS